MDTGELGAAIRRKRKSLRISQKALAAQIGVVPRTIFAWEKGTNGGAWDQIPALERVLGPLEGVLDEPPSIAAALAALRSAAMDLDIAREILYALEPPE